MAPPGSSRASSSSLRSRSTRYCARERSVPWQTGIEGAVESVSLRKPIGQLVEDSGGYAVALRGEDEAKKHEMGHQHPPVRAEPVKQAIPVKIRTECLDQMSHIGAVEPLAFHDERLRPDSSPRRV